MQRELGQKKAFYTNMNKKRHAKVAIILCWIAAIFFGFISLAGFIGEYVKSDTPKNAQLVWVFFTGFCMFIWLAISISKARYIYIEIYDHGLIIGEKDKITPIFFDEIRSTRWEAYKIKFSHLVYFTIERTNGETLRLSNQLIRELNEIGDQIEQAIANQKIPALISRLQAGETIEMCNLILTASGIQVKEGFLPWHEVDHAELHNKKQQLIIWKKGPQPSVWKNLFYFNEPNLTLLTSFINTYATNSAQTTSPFMSSDLGFRF